MAQISSPAAILYFDQHMDVAEVHSIAGGMAAVFSARCPGKETPNEDSAALIPFDEKSGVLVVADGMGGGRSGHQASSLAVEAIQDSLAHAQQEGGLSRDAILNGFENANRAVLDLSLGAATTLLVLEIQENEIRSYHVGDSMILVVGQRGKIKMQTICHSPVGFAVEAGILDADEALHHEDRHLVSNMIGLSDMRIEVGSSYRLAPRDRVLLASDGLFDNLQVDEIVEMLRKGPLDKVAKKLAEAVTRRMGNPTDGNPSKPDDLTFVTFRLDVPS